MPGFLAFAVVFLLYVLREQHIALVSLTLLGIGTAVTGFFPNVLGLYLTTVFMSVGYHYYETIQTSLSLQWVDKQNAPEVLGRIIAVGAFTSILTFGAIWLAFDLAQLDFVIVYLIAGGATLGIVIMCSLFFPTFPTKVQTSSDTWCFASGTGSITDSFFCQAPADKSLSFLPGF